MACCEMHLYEKYFPSKNREKATEKMISPERNTGHLVNGKGVVIPKI